MNSLAQLNRTLVSCLVRNNSVNTVSGCRPELTKDKRVITPQIILLRGCFIASNVT